MTAADATDKPNRQNQPKRINGLTKSKYARSHQKTRPEWGPLEISVITAVSKQ